MSRRYSPHKTASALICALTVSSGYFVHGAHIPELHTTSQDVVGIESDVESGAGHTRAIKQEPVTLALTIIGAIAAVGAPLLRFVSACTHGSLCMPVEFAASLAVHARDAVSDLLFFYLWNPSGIFILKILRTLVIHVIPHRAAAAVQGVGIQPGLPASVRIRVRGIGLCQTMAVARRHVFLLNEGRTPGSNSESNCNIRCAWRLKRGVADYLWTCAGSTTVAALETVPTYITDGAYLMNRDLNGRCLDFGVWDFESYQVKHLAITKQSGPAYVNSVCHGDQWQRYKFDGELIRGAHSSFSPFLLVTCWPVRYRGWHTRPWCSQSVRMWC
jgi:hypothetical protein